MTQFFKQRYEAIKGFLEPIPINACVQEVKIRNTWIFFDLKRVINLMNLFAGNPFYENEAKSKLFRYHFILLKMNFLVAFMESFFFLI